MFKCHQTLTTPDVCITYRDENIDVISDYKIMKKNGKI